MNRAKLDARGQVLQALAEHGATSRGLLARETGLAFSTVSAIVTEMQADGAVVEASADAVSSVRGATGSAGRTSTLVSLGRRAGVVVGVEVGKQHMHVVLSDLAHAVLAERRLEASPDLGASDCASLLASLVSDLLEECGEDRGAVLGVGMGLPGPIRRPGVRVGDSAILPGWVGVEAADLVGSVLGLSVSVENDANLGALGEWMWGAGRGCDDLLFVKAATGIGAGLIVGGRLHIGVGGTAGEIGHTAVDPGGVVCRCGNRGCLETLAGSQAVLRTLSSVRPGVSLDEVIAAAVAGDVGCRRVIGDAGQAIGAVLGNVCNVINPCRVIVGGELSAAGELLIAPLRAALARTCLASALGDLEVVKGHLSERAVALGGVGLVLRDVVPALAERSRRR